MTKHYTLKQIEAMPTLHQGHTDNLKIDEPNKRIWLSRLTIEDGQPYNNQVTVEEYQEKGKAWEHINNPGWKWVIVDQYEAK